MEVEVSEYGEISRKKGIRHIFGVTGGGAIHLNDAFGKIKNEIYFHHDSLRYGC